MTFVRLLRLIRLTRNSAIRLGEPTLASDDSGLYVEMPSALRVSAPIPPRFECQKSILSVCSGTVLEMLKSATVSIDHQKGSLA